MLAPIVGNAEVARDIVQEAFAVALREERTLRRRESLAPWVWQIAFRLAQLDIERTHIGVVFNFHATSREDASATPCERTLDVPPR